jgi:uncharacterized glyoxalase superfamily protein PhnB
MKKLTPNLIVESIEKCLPFWVERVGFTKILDAPEGDRLGFVILQHGKVELMLQSRASVLKDVPAIASGAHRTVLYFEVEDLAAIRQRLKDWPFVVPERKTSYGAREIIVRDPEGNAVFFAVQEG